MDHRHEIVAMVYQGLKAVDAAKRQADRQGASGHDKGIIACPWLR
jgi:hypothetical protein